MESTTDMLEKLDSILGTTKQKANKKLDANLKKDTTPPLTGYNSYDGYKLVGDMKVYHGQRGPDGKIVDAPILTDEQWAKRYEAYEFRQKIWNAQKNRYDEDFEMREAHLNDVDKRLMTIFNDNDRVVVLAFRGAHKSINLQRRVLRCILDLHMSVVYFSDNVENATKVTNNIRSILSSEKIIQDYGFVIDPNQPNRVDKFYFKWQSEQSGNQPGMAIGSVEGKSQMGGHPDVLALDDVCEESLKGSETRLEKLIDWFTRQIAPMARGHTLTYVVGTMKDPKDLYNYLEGTDMYRVERIRAIEEWPNGGQMKPGDLNNRDGLWYYYYYQGPKDPKPYIKGVAGLRSGRVGFDRFDEFNWTIEGRVKYFLNNNVNAGWDCERMAMQEFLLRRREIGNAAFESEYQMNAVTVEAGMLNFDKLQFFNSYTLPDADVILKENVCAFYDQSLGSSDVADYNCIAVVAEYMDVYYILDIFVWKNMGDGVYGKLQKILQVFQKYPELRVLGIEQDMAQSADAKFIENYLEEKPIEPFLQSKMDTYGDKDDEEHTKLMIDFGTLKINPLKKAKIIRIINQWMIRLDSERVFIRENINTEGLDEFQNEFSFPKCKKFDALDAIGSCFSVCQLYSNKEILFDGGRLN